MNSLDRQAGGPDDNSAQAGHLIAHQVRPVAFATSSLDSPRDDGLTPPLKKNVNGQNTGSGASVFASTSQGVRRLTPVECCRLQGFPDGWFGEPNERPDGPRYAALGDAVTVNVAEWLGERLMDAA